MSRKNFAFHINKVTDETSLSSTKPTFRLIKTKAHSNSLNFTTTLDSSLGWVEYQVNTIQKFFFWKWEKIQSNYQYIKNKAHHFSDLGLKGIYFFRNEQNQYFVILGAKRKDGGMVIHPNGHQSNLSFHLPISLASGESRLFVHGKLEAKIECLEDPKKGSILRLSPLSQLDKHACIIL